MAAFGSGESGGDGSPPGSSGGSGRSVSKCRGLCSLSFFTGFGGRISFGLSKSSSPTKIGGSGSGGNVEVFRCGIAAVTDAWVFVATWTEDWEFT